MSGGSKLLNTSGFGLEVARSGFSEGSFFLLVLCTSMKQNVIEKEVLGATPLFFQSLTLTKYLYS